MLADLRENERMIFSEFRSKLQAGVVVKSTFSALRTQPNLSLSFFPAAQNLEDLAKSWRSRFFF